MKVAQVLVGLAATSEAKLVKRSKTRPVLGREELIEIPYHSYKNDCWKKRPVSTSFVQTQKNPGAGMDLDAIEPFVTVEKDGFMSIACIQDALYQHGDKHGNHKDEYTMGVTANISIVRYDAFVPKEDQKAMTHALCFEFCRTVPDMNFFGIRDGRDCYCAPYFKSMAAGAGAGAGAGAIGESSSWCDETCAGDPNLMCGGKKRSSIFEMHNCDHTEAQLGTAVDNVEDAMESLQGAADTLLAAADQIDGLANTLQTIWGEAGDPDASNLCQEAKVYAGELYHLKDDAQELLDSTESRKQEANTFKGKNFKTLENAKGAEKAIADLNDGSAKIGEMEDTVEAKLTDLLFEEEEVDNGDLAQYVSVMTYVGPAHKARFTDVPSTCTGELLQVVTGKSLEGCAAMCDDTIVRGCKVFQFMGEGDGLCFFFKDVKKATYWTGCGEGTGKPLGRKLVEENGLAFLEKKSAAAPFPAKCMVKSADYQRTDLTPDRDGNNIFALKELTKADRCY